MSLGTGRSGAAAAIREGRVSSAELVEDCLSRVQEVDGEIQAWAFLDPDHGRRAARAADEHRMAGRAIGPLHGVPIGIKDIFDTSDYPTEFGSALWKGRTPRNDAAAVARLRAAGAIIMGKTVTTEYAYFHPGKTRNPHDPSRTPGGSSSGSAAAVAAGMVPAAIGSQTNGSVIRPASFCGVVGFKPTHGLIPRSGALLLSRALDHVGVFARSVDRCRAARRCPGRPRRRGPRHASDREPATRADGSRRTAADAAAGLRERTGVEGGRTDARRGVRRTRRSPRRRRSAGRAWWRASIEQSSFMALSWRSRWRTTSAATWRKGARC